MFLPVFSMKRLRSLSKDEQIRTVDRHCIAEFLEEKGINTRGKLLKILKDGYQMYKDNLGIEDEFELQRDSFWLIWMRISFFRTRMVDHIDQL